MTHIEKLDKLRGLMIKNQVDVYIVASSDPHISEYLPEHFKALKWLSGFTGSMGTLVITHKEAHLWADSRYFIQAEEQLKGSGFVLKKLEQQGSPEYIAWILNNITPNGTIAFDGKMMSAQLALLIKNKAKGLTVRSDIDLLNDIWTDRKSLTTHSITILSESEVGESAYYKINRLRQELETLGADYHLISSLDDIAWLLNVRGADIKCNPLVISHLIISQDNIFWFVDKTRITEEQQKQLRNIGIQFHKYQDIRDSLNKLPTSATILLDTSKVCQSVYEYIPDNVQKIVAENPTTLFKAVKNEVEQAHIRQTMVYDGVALVRFFKWLEDNIGDMEINELSASAKLQDFRSEQPNYVGDSFGYISGYKAHGAVVHYSATVESNIKLQQSGLYLIDSGGQYKTGTTDITRVVALGTPTEQEKLDYTLVLQGMIDLSMVKFPSGTKGYQLDAFARKWLWSYGFNYGHGTGHGVGFYLNVHEGPHCISPAPVNVSLVEGMLMSNEPGIYREGSHGVRIENLILCQKDICTEFGQFFNFETVTICPIDTKPIKKEQLTSEQLTWLNNYHSTVYNKLSPLLTEDEQVWLKEKTRAI